MKRYSGKDVMLLIFDLLQVPYKDFDNEYSNVTEVVISDNVYSFYYDENDKLYRITEISDYCGEAVMKELFDIDLGIIESEGDND